LLQDSLLLLNEFQLSKLSPDERGLLLSSRTQLRFSSLQVRLSEKIFG